MKFTVPLALFGWPVVTLLLFMVMRPRRAVIASILLGWLFLPISFFKVVGLPVYNKDTAVFLSALLGALLFDARRVLAFRPGWADIPMALWCVCPFFSSVANDLGFGDGFTTLLYQTLGWGVPYLLGRIYLSSLLGMYELAVGIFIGGLIYLPLCLLEIRLSPQLHSWVYGFHQHVFEQTIRWGGFRPTVFMDHGLMVSMWMAMSTLAGFWLWQRGTLRTLFRIPMPWLVLAMLVTTVLCKSMGAIVLLGVGVAVLLATKYSVSRVYLLGLASLPLLYMGLRTTEAWSGSDLTQIAAIVNPGRAKSLEFRLMNEDQLIRRAWMRPALGWGGWGRARVRDSSGRDVSVTDGLWIIAFGNHGLLGLCAWASWFMVSVGGLVRRLPVGAWNHRYVAAAVALCTIVVLFLVDCLFNGMKHPAYILAGGGLAYLKLGKVKSPQPAIQATDARWAPDSSS